MTAFLDALMAVWKFWALSSSTAKLLCEMARPTTSWHTIAVPVDKLDYEVGVDSVA